MSRLPERVREWEGARLRPFNHSMPSVDDGAWDLFTAYLAGRGLNPILARTNGWYPSTQAGDHVLRVVIPASTRDPRNVFWQARAMVAIEPRYQSPHAPRGDAVVVVHPNKPPAGSCVVEGPMDALAAAMTGLRGIALMGGTPDSDSIRNAIGWCSKSLTWLVADRDDPGGMAKLLPSFPGAKLVIPSPFKDLAEMPLSERMKLLC